MFWELLATLFAGFAGAGVALLLNIVTRGRMPKATMPAMAAGAMFLAAISSEMTWYGRSVGQLPDNVVITSTHESRAIYRPWTYVWPMVDRFIAADVDSAQTNPDVPHQSIVDLYLLERWQASNAVQVAVDCTRKAQTLMAVATFAESGEIDAPAWESLVSDDPLLLALCTQS